MTGDSLSPEVTGMLAADRSLDGPGIEIVSASGGHAVARMTVDGDQVNGHGRVHGGLVFMLADTALACAANSVLAPAVTGGAEVTFLSGAGVGEVLVAEAVVRTTSGRTVILDVTVVCGDRVVAEVRGRAVRLRDAGPGSGSAPL